MGQPVPFTIVRNPGEPEVATNGTVALVVDGGIVKLRRGIRTAAAAPLAERLLPQLNALAGDILGKPMTNEELAARLHAMQVLCAPVEQQNIEWAFGEIKGVRVYTDGKTILLTEKDVQVG